MFHVLLVALAISTSVQALVQGGRDVSSANDAAENRTNTMNLALFRAAAKPVHHDCKLFIAVYLSPQDWKAEFIRDTMMKNLDRRFNGEVDMRFVLGTHDLHVKQYLQLLGEQERYGDYLLLDIPESYDLLTGKTAALVQWAATEKNLTAKYILKADDDSYVHVGRLLSYLKWREHSEATKNTVYGLLRENSKIIRPNTTKNPKWWEPDFPGDTYPVYADGGGYVFTRSLAQLMRNRYWDIVQRNMYHNEDASFGIWSNLINASLIEQGMPEEELIHYRQLPMIKKRCRENDVINGDMDIRQYRCMWRKEERGSKHACCRPLPRGTLPLKGSHYAH